MKLQKRLLVVLAVTALAVGLVAPSPASAHDNQNRRSVEITRGRVITLPGGQDLGYAVEGRAVMVKMPGLTVVAVHVRGLDARRTYPTHVHNAPCSATPAGGSHYQHEVGTEPDFVNDANEIWPFVRTNRNGRGHGYAVHTERARDGAMSIVIHNPADTSIRLACIDLS